MGQLFTCLDLVEESFFLVSPVLCHNSDSSRYIRFANAIPYVLRNHPKAGSEGGLAILKSATDLGLLKRLEDIQLSKLDAYRFFPNVNLVSGQNFAEVFRQRGAFTIGGFSSLATLNCLTSRRRSRGPTSAHRSSCSRYIYDGPAKSPYLRHGSLSRAAIAGVMDTNIW